MKLAVTETSLTAAQKRVLYHWGPDVFGTAALDVSDLLWSEFPTGFLLTLRNEPVSYFRALRHTCTINGQSVELGGLGGLVTVPEHQHQGYGSRVTKIALKALRTEWRVDAALAFCLDPLLPFYRRLGAIVLPGPVMVQTRSGFKPAPFNALWWPFRSDLASVTGFDLGGPLW